MAHYRFLTDLRVGAAIDDVYRLLVEPEGWLDDWVDALRVERTREGDEDGRGRTFDATVRAPMGYHLSARITTAEVEHPHRLDMVSSGDLEGTGRWDLAEADGVTDVSFDWDVRTTPRWMDVLTPVLRPLFERSHHVVVRNAARAAAASLDAELLHARSRALRHPPARTGENETPV